MPPHVEFLPPEVLSFHGQVEAQLPVTAELEVWFGEPVKALAVAVTAFTSNRKGFPVLPRAHQDFLSRFLQMGVQVLLPAPRPPASTSPPGCPLPVWGCAICLTALYGVAATVWMPLFPCLLSTQTRKLACYTREIP